MGGQQSGGKKRGAKKGTARKEAARTLTRPQTTGQDGAAAEVSARGNMIARKCDDEGGFPFRFNRTGYCELPRPQRRQP